MRVGIFMYVSLYCVWRIKSHEASVLSTTKGVSSEDADDEKTRSGRDRVYLYPPPLVSPYGGTLKLLMGIAVPISIRTDRILVFGQNFQFQFPIPQNATFFTNYYDDAVGRTRRWKRTTSSKRSRNIVDRMDKNRSIFYRSLESAIDRWGGSGRDCVMKSICEAAETPLHDEGLVGQLLHVILTPDYGMGKGFNASRDDDDYLRAARAGKSGRDCSVIYPSCPEGRGLLDRVTKLHCT